MSLQTQSALAPMVHKLQLWAELDSVEQDAILALPHRTETVEPGAYIVREGEKPEHSCLLLSGFAFRQKMTGDGGRSISALHLKGDIVDLQNSLLRTADHSVQALSIAEIARIPREAIIELAFRLPKVGLAMWYDTLVDASIFREWIANNARRKAEARIAHIICEFGVRLEALGLGERCSYQFPMTQEQLADATGLTTVHVNRSLKSLEARGLLTRTTRYVAVGDWPSLQRAGDFDEAYLHLAMPRR
jgi:CRP-like cAMP-binding protein